MAMGRPRKQGARRLMLTIRLTEAEMGALAARAGQADRSVWAREVLLRELEVDAEAFEAYRRAVIDRQIRGRRAPR